MSAFSTSRMGTPPLGKAPRPAITLHRLGPAAQLRAGRLPRRFAQLLTGLVLYGLTLAMMLRSVLGNAPWDVLHQGIAEHLPLSIGTVVIAVSFLVLLLWIPLREIPGIGTLLNSVLVGLSADFFLGLIAVPSAPGFRVLLLAGGIALNGLATALYLGSQFGPGPRDGLMTGLHRRTGLSLRLVRTGLEVTVVIAGFLLGGVVGIGTLAYALAIGPLVQSLLPRLVVDLPGPDSVLGGDQRGGVRRHHHLGGGETLVGEPGLAQRVHSAVGQRRPHLAGAEVVHHHDAALLDQIDHRVDRRVLG